MSTPFTAEALQSALNVTEDGKWGPETEMAMREALDFPKDNTNRKWGKKRLIIGYQQKLMKEAGVEVDIDGLIGPRTIAAFEKYRDLKSRPEAEQVKVAAAMWWDGWLDAFRNWLWPKKDAAPVAAPPKELVKKPSTVKKSDAGLVHTDWPRQRDVPSFYGPVGENQTRIKCPWPMVLAWDTKTAVNAITLHKKVAPSAERALKAIFDHYGPEGVKELGLHLYGGSLNVRKVRGGSTYSMHSWGIAIDWDPDRNQLNWDHTKARLARPDAQAFWDIWEGEGWLSLGRARDYDWMHVQAAKL